LNELLGATDGGIRVFVRDKLKINSVLKQCLAGRDYEIESFSGIQCLRNLFIIGSCEA
jgi:hypothetical protein